MMLHKIKMRGNLGHKYREVGWFCLGETEDFLKGLDCWTCVKIAMMVLKVEGQTWPIELVKGIGAPFWRTKCVEERCPCAPLAVYLYLSFRKTSGWLSRGAFCLWGKATTEAPQLWTRCRKSHVPQPAGLRTQNPGAVSSAQRLSGTLISRLSLKRWTVQISSCAC